MSDLLNETNYTDYVLDKLKPLGLEISIKEPLTLEIHYGPGEPVLAINLKEPYQTYLEVPTQLDHALEPYLVEIGWTIQKPRYASRDIFENTFPVMKDILIEPIAQDGETVTLNNKEIVLRLPKGPVLFQDLVKRTDEHLVVQFVLEKDKELLELCRGDVLTCFPEPVQIAGIAIQNLARRALSSGLTTRGYRVENFSTEITLVGFRDEGLSGYVASLINIAEVMAVLERNLNAQEGMLAIIPTRDQLLLTTNMEEQNVCEMGLLAGHLKDGALKNNTSPVSSLVWRFKDGDITGLQSIRLEET
jgi:hypothetical protein